LQTPQREWLREELRDWAHGCIEGALAAFGGTWLDRDRVRNAWKSYCAGFGDNSFTIWQWINLALWADSSCRVETQGTQR
jgi:asparagine synthase (glutamine-hydrolysing)